MLKAIGCEKKVFDFIENAKASANRLHTYVTSNQDYVITPAFVDLQVNGYAGVSLDSDYSIESLIKISDALKRDGVCLFAPTVITCDYEYMSHVLNVTREFQKKYPNKILGVHLEGPFISLKKSGIHPKNLVRKLSPKDLELLLSYKDAISYLTCAPNAVSLADLKVLIDSGIKISLGHADATYDEATEFIKNGASLGTHLYNAMSKAPNGRNLGVAESLLANKVYTGVIVDGVHVALPLVKLAYEILKEKFILVTDALAAAGISAKEFKTFKFANTEIINSELEGCINKDGTLAGSRLTMIDGFKNLLKLDIGVKDAIYAATIAPLKALDKTNNRFYNIFDKDFNLIEGCIELEG